MSKIVITGATGLIGSALARTLRERGDEVLALSRRPGAGTVAWPDPQSSPPPPDALAGADAVVHLLGEPIAQRWTAAVKQAIRDSRVQTTAQLVRGIEALRAADRPKVLVSQSATGYYGPRGPEPLTEDAGAGGDFLATVVADWEQAAAAAEPLMRVVRTRTGVVLAPGGGALGTMLPFFKLGIGGPVAGGRQYVPWIHLDDTVAGLIRCVDDTSIAGAVNLTAPNPVPNKEFSRALGTALRRPAFMPVPGFALKAMYGEMSVVVTTGQNVVPARLQAAEFPFRYPEVEPALRALLS